MVKELTTLIKKSSEINSEEKKPLINIKAGLEEESSSEDAVIVKDESDDEPDWGHL